MTRKDEDLSLKNIPNQAVKHHYSSQEAFCNLSPLVNTPQPCHGLAQSLSHSRHVPTQAHSTCCGREMGLECSMNAAGLGLTEIITGASLSWGFGKLQRENSNRYCWKQESEATWEDYAKNFTSNEKFARGFLKCWAQHLVTCMTPGTKCSFTNIPETKRTLPEWLPHELSSWFQHSLPGDWPLTGTGCRGREFARSARGCASPRPCQEQSPSSWLFWSISSPCKPHQILLVLQLAKKWK